MKPSKGDLVRITKLGGVNLKPILKINTENMIVEVVGPGFGSEACEVRFPKEIAIHSLGVLPREIELVYEQ